MDYNWQNVMEQMTVPKSDNITLLQIINQHYRLSFILLLVFMILIWRIVANIRVIFVAFINRRKSYYHEEEIEDD